MACPESETLALLLHERLLSPLREQVEAHIEGCEACQAHLEQLSGEDPPLHGLHPGPRPAPAEFHATASFLARIGDRGAFRLAPPEPGSDWPQIEGYEILGELGSGGMGRVYRARHLGLGRQVALKVIKPGPSAELLRGRLEQEAMALARLRHPNIVQVYDVGISEGQAFLALELIEGVTLASWLNGLPQLPDMAAHLAWVLAGAVDYAHRNGILHRDLKPANVLVESAPDEAPPPGAEATPPRIKITDFGLAKAITEGDPLAGGLTATGDLIGTPQYMAPEQGSGLRGPIGPGADIYALGVILYELLTGQPPFRGETPLKTILQVVHEAPPSLSHFRPRIPADLATICMKCLEKSPSRRYASAGALAEDLRRFLAREPITARPVGPLGQLARWSQRKPRLAAMAGAMIGSGALAFGLVSWQWRTAEAARARAEGLAVSEAAATAEAWAERDRAEMAGRESERIATELLLDESLAACERGEIIIGLAGIERIGRKAEELGFDLLAEVCRANIACWSGRLRVVASSPQLGTLVAVAYSPDGTRVLAILRPGGDEVAGPDLARLWDPEGWKPIGPPLAHEGSVTAIAFSPDGKSALTGAADGSVRAWDAASGEPAGPPLRGLKSVAAVAFHPDGRRFAAGGRSLLDGGRGEVRIWGEADDGAGAAAAHPFAGPVEAIAFSPDGALLATASRMPGTAKNSPCAEVCQWDLASKGKKGPRLIHSATVRALAYSPDGKWLATGGDDRIAVFWDRETGARSGRSFAHRAGIRSLTFTPDGKTLVIAGEEAEPGIPPERAVRREAGVRLWDIDSGKLHPGLIAPDVIHAIALGPGARMAAAARDGQIHLIEPKPDAAAKQPLPFSCSLLAYSPDGKLLIAVGGRRGTPGDQILALDPATGAPLRPPASHPSKIIAIAIASAGGAYAAALEDGTVRTFDTRTDLPLGPALGHPGPAGSLAFSPDGERLLAVVPGSVAHLWDWRAGEPAWSSPPGDAPRAVALSPDGRKVLVAWGGNAGIGLWDLAAGGPPRELWTGPPARFVSADFSPDGRFALAGDEGGVAHRWELATGRAAETALQPRYGVITRMGLIGDGTRAYAVDDHLPSGLSFVYAWEPQSGRPPKQLRYRANSRTIASSLDRRFLAIGGWTGGVRLWDAATGHQIGPELAGAGNVVAIACSPDGRLIATADEEDTLSIWRIPLPGSPLGPTRSAAAGSN